MKGPKIVRYMLKSSVVSLFVLLTLSSPLRAQVVARSVDVSGNIGFSNLSGSETVDTKKHVAFGGAGAYNFNRMSSLGFEYSYQMLGSETQNGVKLSGHIQSYGGVYRVSLIKSKGVVPYDLVAGGGLSETAVGSGGGIKASASQNGYYIGFGGGASIYAGPHWGIRPEFRYERQQFLATTINGAQIATYGQNYILGTVSLFCQFGGKK